MAEDSVLTPVESPSARVRQACYSARMRAVGLVQVAVWVPQRDAAELHAVAMRLRAESGLILPSEVVAGQLSLFAPDEEAAA